MINFCVEPKKPCRKNPIGELDFKIDKCYSSIYSRLCCHENDSVSHISQEERDEWNGKASKEALNDIQDQLNKITSDESGSMKYEILLEVSKQITAAIDGLNLGDYAKKKYVDDAIKNINLDGYVTKDHADSTYLKKVDYKKFDADSYYTKADIQKIIEDSTIGKDYPIEGFTLEYNELILTQKNGGQFRVALSESGSDGGVSANYVQQQLLNYIKKNTLSKLIINDKAYSIESGRDIKIPISGAGSSIDYTKFGYNKSYFKKQPSNSVAPSKPSANRPPKDGSGWVDDAPNQEAGYYIWMTQVFINGNGQYGEYTNPICLTGTAGESAVSYDIKTSTSIINYQDGAMYPKTISVYVVKSNGSQITNITPSNGSGWSFSYSVDGGTAWTVISADQIQTEGDNGMLFKATNGTITLSEYVPIVRSGINVSTYSLQLSNISLSYVPADQSYNLQMSCNVNLYKNENAIDSTDANLYNLYMQLNSNDRTTLQYNTDHWDATVNTTVQSKFSTITIYAYNTNGAYLTSMTIPVSASGDTSIGQTFKGSPLRIADTWRSGAKYYDGKREAGSGNIGGFTISDKSLVSESGSIIKFFNRQTTGTTLKLDINVGNELYAYQETANLCPVLYIEDIKSGNDIYEPAGIAINSRKSNNDQTTAILVQSGYISGLREPVTNIVNNFGSAGIGGPYDYGGTFIVKSDNVHVRLDDECLKGTQHTYIMQGACTISFSSDKSNIYRYNSAKPSTEASFSGNSLWIRCLFDGTNWYLCE